MDYPSAIREAASDPRQLEALYREAVSTNQVQVFREAIENQHRSNPGNLLFAAWFYRLAPAVQPEMKKELINRPWLLAVVAGALTGLAFFGLSDFEALVFLDHIPYLILIWAPIAALFVTGFLALVRGEGYLRAGLSMTGLAAVVLYVLLLAPTQGGGFHRHYLDLMALHLPLMAWVAVGISLIGLEPHVRNRFAFLLKSLEVFITGGLFASAGGIFAGITMGMFLALGVEIPETLLRLGFAGGAGMIPPLAIATIYDPNRAPDEQDFSLGLSRLISTLMRLLLPLSLFVLLIYVVLIPFNFMAPFENREVLIVYNAMQFAIMALLVGVSPLQSGDLSPRYLNLLRRGVLALVTMALVVSVYALAAVVYRTIQGGLTVNRFAVTGWNVVNITLLSMLAYRLSRRAQAQWVEALQSVFSSGAYAYAGWGLLIILLIPLLFR